MNKNAKKKDIKLDVKNLKFTFKCIAKEITEF
jgi:hypothetical protein